MSKFVYDFEDNDFLYPISDTCAIDSDGDLHIRVSDDFTIDMESGELHFISGWGYDDD